jgi:polyisoprenyl-teichoic acid--peptidoglycan teichoic acid transferase
LETRRDLRPIKKRRNWKRITLWVLLGVVVVVLAVGGGSYLWFRGQIGAANERVDADIIEALKEKPSTTLTTRPPTTTSTTTSEPGSTSTSAESTTTSTEPPVESPTGMNIVLLGADKRAEGSSEVTEGRSDVIILVHIDPEQNYLSMLSVPRDLRANVPGYGHHKINAAYAYGGGALVIRTIQSVLGVDLNHYIGVDLEAFKAITDELGGVYIDVDRPYADGKIVFDPGYQLLDGLHALRFVRTRHDQNIDFGRNERQQRFLAAVREQAMGWNLPLKLPGLVSAVFDNVDTDLGANDVLKLAYWATKLDGSRIKSSAITGATGSIGGSFYILPTEEELANAVADFLSPPDEIPAQATAASGGGARPDEATVAAASLGGVTVDVLNNSGRVGEAALAAVWLQRQGATLNEIRDSRENPITNAVVTYPASRADAGRRVAQSLGIADARQSDYVDRVTVTLGQTYAFPGGALGGAPAGSVPDVGAWRALAGKVDFPVLAPTYVPPTCRYSFQRSYDISVGRDSEPAFRVGYRFLTQDKYLGFSGTTWLDAPLASPGPEVEAGGVTFTAVGTAAKAERVWWVKDDVLYWVTNTLFHEITREQLLSVAISAVSVSGAR